MTMPLPRTPSAGDLGATPVAGPVRTASVMLPPGCWTDAVGEALARLHVRVAAGGRPVTLVVPEGTDAARLLAVLRSAAGDAPVRIGLGSPYVSRDEYERSRRESEQALGLVPPGRSGVLRFEDLGFAGTILRLADATSLRAYVDGWLGPLIRYDRTRHRRLVETLATYLAQPSKTAARELSVAKRTLSHRLERIRELSGLTLTDPNVRFHLQLACRIWQALEAVDAVAARPADTPRGCAR